MMAILTFILVVIIAYLVLLFFDSIFKSCAHYPYIQFLHTTGLRIKPFFIQWHTTAFNRILVRWGCRCVRFLNVWFTVGVCATVILLPISIILILYAIIQIFRSDNAELDLIVEPVLPGINLPLSELGYYSFTLICCSIIHEIGHALAAVKEDVHIINVGLNILFIIPITYVNISSEKLQNANPWKALRILCAGVWHNFAFALLAWNMYLILPFIFSVSFAIDQGVYINGIDNKSPLLGMKGVQPGDIIIKINDCDVTDDISWTECLSGMRLHKHGLCVDSEMVQLLDESLPLKQLPDNSYDCCGPTKGDWLCFEYIDNNNGIVALPPHTCLPARKIIEAFSQFCTDVEHTCMHDRHCIIPMLPNNTSLLVMKRFDKQNVIYLGHPMDIMYTLQVSSFIPKYSSISTFIPDTVMKLLRYMILFSIGFGLVNVIPCAYMDGQHITYNLVQVLFKKQPHKVNLISNFITLCGTTILLFQCIYTVWTRLLK